MGANDDDSTLSIGKKISAITNGEVDIIGSKIKFATKDSDGNAGSTFTMEQLVNEIGDPVNGIKLNADQIEFATTDGQPYATFKETVTNIVNDVEIGGNLTANSLKTATSSSGTNTEISEGTAVFKDSTGDNRVEIGIEGGQMVLKFYSNGTCLYNLGPAGFKKV